MAGVTIVFGADEEQYEAFVGTTFKEAEVTARQILSVPSDASVELNGSTNVLSTKILKEGDTISFYKLAGKKGFY